MKLYYTAAASFVSLLLIAYIMNRTGFFKKTVYTLLLAAEGSCIKLYLSILAFTALSVCIFNNLYVALIFLPVLYEILKDGGFDDRLIIIFTYSCIVISEVSSICFVTGSINNLIYSEKYHINFNQYASNMFLIGVAGIITCTCLLYILFKNELKGNFKTENLKNPDDIIKDWSLYNIEITVLFAAIIGCFLSSFFNYNYSIVLITSALILYILYLLKGYGELKISANKIIVISLALVFAAFNIFYNVDSKNNYIFNISNKSSYAIGTELIYGFIQMIFSWIINNITVSIGGTFFLDKVSSSFVFKEQIIYLSILFCNVGSILSPIGSVSTIIFLKFIKKVDLKMKLSEYIKMSVKTVLPVLFVMILIFFIFN